MNVNKGGVRGKNREKLLRWVHAERPDVLLLQEVCKSPGDAQDLNVDGYALLTGNHQVAALVADDLRDEARVVAKARAGSRRLSVDLAGIRLHNLYLPSDGGTKGREERADLLGRVAADLGKQRKLKHCLFGDFNLAPRPEDGRKRDGTPSPFNNKSRGP